MVPRFEPTRRGLSKVRRTVAAKVVTAAEAVDKAIEGISVNQRSSLDLQTPDGSDLKMVLWSEGKSHGVEPHPMKLHMAEFNSIRKIMMNWLATWDMGRSWITLMKVIQQWTTLML